MRTSKIPDAMTAVTAAYAARTVPILAGRNEGARSLDLDTVVAAILFLVRYSWYFP
jgi:hypothetical protein